MPFFKYFIFIFILWGNIYLQTDAQIADFKNYANSISSSSSNGEHEKKDSAFFLKKRDKKDDSITIFYRTWHSSKLHSIDTSLTDYNDKFPISYQFFNVGNVGTASHSNYFNPIYNIGFDAGFHSFDVYFFKLANTKLFETTKPFTTLGFQTGTNNEQLFDIFFTRNINKQLNFTFDYRFLNAPGFLSNQNTNLNTIQLTTNYQSFNKRYSLFCTYIFNKTGSAENGGLVDPSSISNSVSLNYLYGLQTKLGVASAYSNNPFTTNLLNGNIYKENHIVIKQYYDFGKQDSVKIKNKYAPIFYPILRIEHQLSFQTYSYQFYDKYADSTKYFNYFNVKIPANTTSINYQDNWTIFTNEFNIYTFPYKLNTAQYVKMGIGLENMVGNFNFVRPDFINNNVYILGGYNNRTKNKIWDLSLNGKLSLTGIYAGNYYIQSTIYKSNKENTNYMLLGFDNINKIPALLHIGYSSFINNQVLKNYNFENIVKLYGSVGKVNQRLNFNFNYYIINGYVYFNDKMQSQQYNTLFNVAHVQFNSILPLGKYFKWYNQSHFQQVVGNHPIHLPLFFTRQRIALEGNYYKKLQYAIGVEAIYNTPYKVDGYYPFNGQFYYQNSFEQNNIPSLNFYTHLKIKGFTIYVRFEEFNNYNVFDNFNETNFNFTSNGYPHSGNWTRIGIWWNLIN